MLSLRMPPAKLRRIDAWRETQDFPPDRTAVILKAIDEFLDARGAPEEREVDKKGRKR